MNKVRHIFLCSIIATSLLFSFPIAAGPAENYREARVLYLTAAASITAYLGTDGNINMAFMRRDGWEVVDDIQKDETTPAKFFFSQKEVPGMPTEYILAIAGTATRKDFELDFKYGKVFFDGRTFDEFEENSGKKQEFPDKVPMVHKGFHEYVQTAFSSQTQTSKGGRPGRKIADLLLADSEKIVYLTGHSSGGSAAILLAARLINMGVKTRQIKIVTFGAPSVGNSVFADKYSPLLDLTRVVVAGDVIPDLLKIFVRGYRQFGREIRWTTSGYTFDEKHYTNIYLDCAIKNYYDTRLLAARAGISEALVPAEKPSIEGKRLYIAAIRNNLSKELDGEFRYMREVLLDQYRDMAPAYVFAEPDAADPLNFEMLRVKAAEADCDRMVIVNIWGSKQDDPATYSGGLLNKADQAYDLLVIEQAVFQVSDGTLLDGRTFQRGSKYFTPLGALVSAAVSMGEDSASWIGQ